jgi:diguanylate cyclase (GGDEF)-like protein
MTRRDTSRENATTKQLPIQGPSPTPGEVNACLVVIRGERLGTRVELKGSGLVIGRAPEADFQVPERSVSRSHCKIFRDRDGYHVKDLESTNHTYLNDQQVSEAPLRDGDHLGVGQTIFKFISHTSIEARYHEELYQLATHDTLTKLNNRRQLLELLDKEIQRSLRTARAFSLIFIDIDHFKPINDELGHLAGDQVLKALAELLAQRVREGDVAARIGGEEFAVLLPETDESRAQILAEVLRAAVEKLTVTLPDRSVSITISIGVAQWRPGMRASSDILAHADDALYRAKSDGRNRVCTAA